MNNRKEFMKFAVKDRGLSSHTVGDFVSSIYGPENMTRTVIEERPMPFREVDVFSRLMADRIIFLGTGVDDYIANIIQAQLLFLESTDPTKDIQIYINSPGGSVYAGLGIYDTMQYIKPEIATICTGMAASMGAVLLCGGAAGKRTALKHSRIMIHSARNSVPDKTSVIDLKILTKELDIKNDILIGILKRHTGRTEEEIRKDMERDYFLTPNSAKEIGLIDNVLLPGDGFPDTKA